MTSIFNTSWEYRRMHVWCKFGDSSPNLWRVLVRTSQISQNSESKIEDQGQWPPFSIPTESIPWCMFGENLVILVQICDELLWGQGKVYGQTDGQTHATTIPLRPERPTGKNGYKSYIEIILCASKLQASNFVLILCPDSTDVGKYNYVIMNIW